MRFPFFLHTLHQHRHFSQGNSGRPRPHAMPRTPGPERPSKDRGPVSPVRSQVGRHQHSLHLLHAAAIHRGVWRGHHHHLLHVDAHIRGCHGSAGEDAGTETVTPPGSQALEETTRQGMGCQGVSAPAQQSSQMLPPAKPTASGDT